MIEPIDVVNLEEMVAQKYIRRQKHPTLDLWIYNYAEKVQYEHMWNNETLQARGLIMDGEYNIVSRPFPKFFNFSETGYTNEELAEEGDFTVTEKMDGSLGISYWDHHRLQIATRGSFVSDQAKRANEILISRYPNVSPNPDHTFLFEIVYPENRIVVDYGTQEDLVLLTAINTKTGEEVPYWELKLYFDVFPIVKQYDGITDFKNLEERPNAEGYVVHFPKTGLRFKLKFEEYKRLHKIITGINAKRIWEFLSNDQPLDELVLRVPDEFYDWIVNVKEELIQKYNGILANSVQVLFDAQQLPDRKTQAAYIIAHKDNAPTSVVFQMLDGKPYEKTIWKLIEPPFERPYKIEV